MSFAHQGRVIRPVECGVPWLRLGPDVTFQIGDDAAGDAELDILPLGMTNGIRHDLLLGAGVQRCATPLPVGETGGSKVQGGAGPRGITRPVRSRRRRKVGDTAPNERQRRDPWTARGAEPLSNCTGLTAVAHHRVVRVRQNLGRRSDAKSQSTAILKSHDPVQGIVTGWPRRPAALSPAPPAVADTCPAARRRC